ncbi:MAG: protein kinase, partial [Cyanobacteria bacterium P01_F01_bin.42]
LLRQLGQGGFGQIYLAEDEHLPDEYQCVVKRFHLGETQEPDGTMRAAKRLFNSEAKALHRLGHHKQLPKLLAHFEDQGEFYLIEEYIPGPSLDTELKTGVALPEPNVIKILRDLLTVLSFVHQQQVVHRDIKPSNIIRRKSDGQLVLIDFGAVKQMTTQMVSGTIRPHTVVIGTPGYMPSEQFRGSPKPSSDVYAVGMIGIQAITGLNPSLGELPEDDATGEIQWQERANVSPELAEILRKMVLYDFRQRYRTAQEALHALETLTPQSLEKAAPKISNPNVDEGTTNLAYGAQSSAATQISGAAPASASLETAVDQSVDDATTAQIDTIETTQVSHPEIKPRHTPLKALLGGGMAIAATGLFALLGAPHIKGVCSTLGNCSATIEAQTNLAAALSVLEASDRRLTSARSIEELDSLRGDMMKALDTLQSISTNKSPAIANNARTSANDYKIKLSKLNERIQLEQDSRNNLNSAVAKASEAYQEKDQANTIAAKDDNISKWQAAVDSLNQIEQPAFVYEQAQAKKQDYEAHIQNLNTSIDTILAEARARQQQEARPARQRRASETPAARPAPSYASSSPVYQEPAYQAPISPTYQTPTSQEPVAPAPTPSDSEPLWGKPSVPQTEPLW